MATITESSSADEIIRNTNEVLEFDITKYSCLDKINNELQLTVAALVELCSKDTYSFSDALSLVKYSCVLLTAMKTPVDWLTAKYELCIWDIFMYYIPDKFGED